MITCKEDCIIFNGCGVCHTDVFVALVAVVAVVALVTFVTNITIVTLVSQLETN